MSQNHPILSKIFIYPVKSLPGIPLEKALVSKDGIMHAENQNVIDRKWMIVDSNRSFLSQRKLPKMALIKQRVEGDYIVLSVPNKKDIQFSVDFKGEKIKCRLWSDYLDCFSYGVNSDVSLWLSEVLENEKLDLVCLENLYARRDGDFSTFMILSESSLNDLNSKLKKKVSIVNFRANLVVNNCLAYSEDTWNKIKISNVSFVKTKHCIRCLMTTVDPNTGVKSPDQEPFKTLKNYRLDLQVDRTSPMFGMYYELENVDECEAISIGDSILITK